MFYCPLFLRGDSSRIFTPLLSFLFLFGSLVLLFDFICLFCDFFRSCARFLPVSHFTHPPPVFLHFFLSLPLDVSLDFGFTIDSNLLRSSLFLLFRGYVGAMWVSDENYAILPCGRQCGFYLVLSREIDFWEMGEGFKKRENKKEEEG